MRRREACLAMFFLAVLFMLSCSDKGTESHHAAPPEPSTPFPADGAIGQAVMPHLTWVHYPWSSTDSVTYNVYFSSDPLPGLAASGLTELAYGPGKLQYNTMYYWRVEACDRYGGCTMGPIWRFTTSATNQAPDPVTDPSPSNDAVNQPLSVLLAWEPNDPDGDSLSYDVYFGPDENPPLVASAVGAASYSVSSLENHTVYYWRIVSHDDHGHETSGPIWMFTTLHTIGHIVPVGSYSATVTYSAVFAYGDHAYVTADADLLVFDVASPESPSLVAELYTPCSGHRDVSVSGAYAYLAAWTSLEVVDISDPAQPLVVGACQDAGVSVSVEDGYAYCSRDGLNIVNVSDVFHPTLSGTYAADLYGLRILVQGDYTFSLHQVGFYVFDVHNKSAPELIADYRDINHDTRLRDAAGIALSGQYAFVVGTGDRARFRIVDISDPANPTMVTYSDIAGGQGVEVKGDYAFVGDGRTLLAINVSDISAPVSVGAYDAPSDITDLFVRDNFVVFASTSSSGLLVFRFVP